MKPALQRVKNQLAIVSELAEKTAVSVERIDPLVKQHTGELRAIRAEIEALGRTIDGLDEKIRAGLTAVAQGTLNADRALRGEDVDCALCRDSGEVESAFRENPTRVPCPKCRPEEAARLGVYLGEPSTANVP